jgi:hypothetical protein
MNRYTRGILAIAVLATACDVGCPCDDGDGTDAGALVEADVTVIEAYEGIQGQGCGYGAVANLMLRDAAAGDYYLAPTANIADCDKCVLLGASCSIANPISCATLYVATEGFLDLVMIVEGEPWDNWFEFVAEDLVLAEHTVDWGTGAVEPVPGGQQICVGSWHMALALADWN